MKILVNTLEGKALDYAVALCEGGSSLWYDTVCTHWVKIDGEDRALSKGWPGQSFVPSVDWSHGGGIIDREKISIVNAAGDEGVWSAHQSVIKKSKSGPTALIAAMRYYVASKLGDHVEIPFSLLKVKT